MNDKKEPKFFLKTQGRTVLEPDKVTVNGVPIGDGVKTPCYFSCDGGKTARLVRDIIAGDVLYFDPEIGDLVPGDYEVPK